VSTASGAILPPTAMTNTRRILVALLTVSVLLVTQAAWAQQWRGLGRVNGKVVDQDGRPIEGVTVRYFLPAAEGGSETKSNRRGEWVVSGISSGNWQLDFTKEGYESRHVAVPISEHRRIPPMEIRLEKRAPAVDANAEIAAGLHEAARLLSQKQYAEAREIYESLLEKYPEAWQLHPLLARVHHAEQNLDKSVEHLRKALEHSPDNPEVTLLLGNVLLEKGDAEEGRRLLDSVDEDLIKDPAIFLNIGIGLMNGGRPKDAMPYFDRAVARFPSHPDSYYFRGLAHLQTGDNDAARADLEKFVRMAPEAPEAETARKILKQLQG
jgi:Tfp pilus assembly protein PilF